MTPTHTLEFFQARNRELQREAQKEEPCAVYLENEDCCRDEMRCPFHLFHCYGCGIPRDVRGWCVECDGEVES